MSERMTLPEALRIVTQVHTESRVHYYDPEEFVVVMGAVPKGWHPNHNDYVHAWRVIRREAFREPFWWQRLKYRIRNLIAGVKP